MFSSVTQAISKRLCKGSGMANTQARSGRHAICPGSFPIYNQHAASVFMHRPCIHLGALKSQLMPPILLPSLTWAPLQVHYQTHAITQTPIDWCAHLTGTHQHFTLYRSSLTPDSLSTPSREARSIALPLTQQESSGAVMKGLWVLFLE